MGALGLVVREYSLRHNYLTNNLGIVELVGTVKSEPSKKNTFLISSESINRKKIHLPLRISTRKSHQLSIGQKLWISGRAVSSKEARSAALVFARDIKVLKDANTLFAFTEKIRKRFRFEAEKVGGDAGSLIPGLVIGDTRLESEEFLSQMRRVGLTHLTAVSGENFAIIAAFIGWFLQRIIPILKYRLFVTGIFLTLFIFLVHPSPSVVRASAMTAVAIIATAKGVPVQAITSLGAAIIILLLIDPFQAIDPGFALSVAATAGIILISPKLPLPQFMAIPISATLLCLPIIIAISGTLSLISIPANILASPLVPPITIIGFIAALLPPIAETLLKLVAPFAKALAFIAHFGASFPVLSLPKSFFGATIVLTSFLIFYLNKKLLILAFSIILIIGVFVANQFPGKNWEVVNCDVGQGDGLVINLGNRQAIVIDVGPDEKKIDKCLRTLGIRGIPLLVLTHFHADHVSGLQGLLRNRSLGQVWLTSYTAPFLQRNEVLKELVGKRELFPTRGERVKFNSPKGLVDISVLWPRATFQNYQNLPGDGSSINNSSIALVIKVDRLKIFATGDIEPPVQQEIFNDFHFGPIDILKVPHHGSAYQYPPLLESAHPKISIISVGRENRYGHPAAKTILFLERIGSKVLRTDLDGAVAVDPSLSIRTKKSEWWDITWG